MWRFSIATKQQIAGFPTISDKVIFPTIVKPLISNKNVQNRPESEQFREMLGVFYFQKQIRKPGAGKEVMQMPRIFPKFSARKPNAPKAKALAKAAGAAAATACKPLAVNCVCPMKSAVCGMMNVYC